MVGGGIPFPMDKDVLEKHPCDTFTSLIAEPAPRLIMQEGRYGKTVISE